MEDELGRPVPARALHKGIWPHDLDCFLYASMWAHPRWSPSCVTVLQKPALDCAQTALLAVQMTEVLERASNGGRPRASWEGANMMLCGIDGD